MNGGHADTSPISGLPVVELADFIVDILPKYGFDGTPKSGIGWDYMVDNPAIQWKTSGVAESDTGLSVRIGIARVRVGGIASMVLRKTWEELPWSIVLSTKEISIKNPKLIVIKPGGDAPEEGCFGYMFRGCDFDISKALSSTKLNSRIICSHRGGGTFTSVYYVSTLGKEPSLIVYERSGGSGGDSAELQIRPLSDRMEFCKESYENQNTLWEHNNSEMKGKISGNSIEIFYSQPRPGMLAAGGRPGSLLFEGRISGLDINGSARIFADHCGQYTYAVSGKMSPSGDRINLIGREPVVDRGSCAIQKTVAENLIFTLVSGGAVPQAKSSHSILSAAEAQMAVAKILIGPLYGSNFDEVAQKIVRQEFTRDRKCATKNMTWEFQIVVSKGADTMNGVNGFIVLDATTGKMICAGLPFLD